MSRAPAPPRRAARDACKLPPFTVFPTLLKATGRPLGPEAGESVTSGRCLSFITGANMGNKIVTEADRKASPRPAAPKGVTVTTHRGQKSSLERGSHTRSKKNPGKRPHSG